MRGKISIHIVTFQIHDRLRCVSLSHEQWGDLSRYHMYGKNMLHDQSIRQTQDRVHDLAFSTCLHRRATCVKYSQSDSQISMHLHFKRFNIHIEGFYHDSWQSKFAFQVSISNSNVVISHVALALRLYLADCNPSSHCFRFQIISAHFLELSLLISRPN